MAYSITPMDEEAARDIAGWRYEPPFSFYNTVPGALPALLNPAHAYYAVRTEDGTLAGFFCFGAEAQVPGGHRQGLYPGKDTLDIGLGLRPELTGHGQGLAFVQAGIDFARRTFAPARFRLSVATFNARAIRVYRRAGFKPGLVFHSPTSEGDTEFLLMSREAGPGTSGDAGPLDDWRQDRIRAAERGENPLVLARMPSGFAVIGDTQFLPGYCVLLAAPRVEKLTDLPLPGRVAYLRDMSLLGEAIERVCRPRRVNYSILGNTDAFLHAHVFPRYDWEPPQYLGNSPFRYPPEKWTSPEYHFSEDQHGELKAQLTAQLGDLMAQAGLTMG
jgi:diadenosine tetraphosphate (Ap4A) HIT family hydrolase/GNAT superfamily N-acetyltransferase